MISPTKWKRVAHVEVYHDESKMIQAASVYRNDDGVYYAAVLNNLAEYVAVRGECGTPKRGIEAAYDLASEILAIRVEESNAEAAQRKLQAEKDRELRVKK